MIAEVSLHSLLKYSMVLNGTQRCIPYLILIYILIIYSGSYPIVHSCKTDDHLAENRISRARGGGDRGSAPCAGPPRCSSGDPGNPYRSSAPRRIRRTSSPRWARRTTRTCARAFATRSGCQVKSGLADTGRYCYRLPHQTMSLSMTVQNACR